MKYTQIINGKEAPFKFQNKQQELTYIARCEIIWGCIPCDINWAIGTNIYKNGK